MEIRNIEESDLGPLVEIYLKAYESDWAPQEALAYLMKFFRFEPGSCLMAVDGNRVLGAVFSFSYTKLGKNILFLQEIFVDPDSRHQGAARALIGKLREALGGPRVKVTPLVKADTNVLNFYNSLGFEQDEFVTFYDDQSYD
jgi:ribosomal protein S18 acetylase RimI-like enzyme